jgi:serine/threonine protein kinase
VPNQSLESRSAQPMSKEKFQESSFSPLPPNYAPPFEPESFTFQSVQPDSKEYGVLKKLPDKAQRAYDDIAKNLNPEQHEAFFKGLQNITSEGRKLLQKDTQNLTKVEGNILQGINEKMTQEEQKTFLNIFGGLNPENQKTLQEGFQRISFINDIIAQKDSSAIEGKIIEQGQELGRGGFGAVYEGKVQSDSQMDVIIKMPLNPTGQEDMEKENQQSNALMAGIAEKAREDTVDLATLQGAEGIVPVLGMSSDGLIQEKVKGNDASKTIQNGMPPYDGNGGYPKDTRGAIMRSLALASEVMVIHQAGFVHCDLKEENVMILDDSTVNQAGQPEATYPPKIIDLGGMKRIGEPIGAHSSNGGPELFGSDFMRMNIAFDIYNRKTIIEQKIQANPNDGELKKEYTRLNDAYNNVYYGNSTQSYDVYSLGTMLMPMLFGAKGVDVTENLFWINGQQKYEQVIAESGTLNTLQELPPDDKTSTEYQTWEKNHEAAKAELDTFRTKYFTDQLNALNKDMKDKTGQCYAPETIDGMAKLLSGMLATNPVDRPTTEEVYTKLADIFEGTLSLKEH